MKEEILMQSVDPMKINENNSSHRIRLRVSMSSHQGGRKYMEDQCAILHYQPPSTSSSPSSPSNSNGQSFDCIGLKPFVFFGIFDGHGGDMAAIYTRENLCRNIVKQKKFWSNDDDKVCLAIHRGFIKTQKDMMKEVGKWPLTSLGLPSTSGTTASVLFIMNGKYYTGHVGDSRIVLGRKIKFAGRWLAFPMTRDHKPESPREKKRIEEHGGQVMNKSGIGRVVWNRPRKSFLSNHNSPIPSYDLIPFLSVARSLGDLWSLNRSLNKFVVSPEPDVKWVPIDESDRCLLLASDGLWNMVSLKNAIRVLQDFEEAYLSENDYNDVDDDEDYLPVIVPNSNSIESNHNGSCQRFESAMCDDSHALKLLNICLDRWIETRFRADNTTVLVVMLDHKYHRVRSSNRKILDHHQNKSILDNNNLIRNNNYETSSSSYDYYNFDLNQDDSSDSLIGDTIRTFDQFDQKQIELNFLDLNNSETLNHNFDNGNNEEVASLLNQILDQVVSSFSLFSIHQIHVNSNNNGSITDSKNSDEDELTENQISDIDFSSYFKASNGDSQNNFMCSLIIDQPKASFSAKINVEEDEEAEGLKNSMISNSFTSAINATVTKREGVCGESFSKYIYDSNFSMNTTTTSNDLSLHRSQMSSHVSSLIEQQQYLNSSLIQNSSNSLSLNPFQNTSLSFDVTEEERPKRKLEITDNHENDDKIFEDSVHTKRQCLLKKPITFLDTKCSEKNDDDNDDEENEENIIVINGGSNGDDNDNDDSLKDKDTKSNVLPLSSKQQYFSGNCSLGIPSHHLIADLTNQQPQQLLATSSEF